MSNLTEDYIPFGKYCGLTIDILLKDRSYVKWLLQEPWFQNYSYLYNRVKEYDPKIFFFPENPREEFKDTEDFLDNWKYFNLTDPENLKIKLPDFFITAYRFYLEMIQNLKNKIIINKGKENVYDIKAPSRFLKRFEKETGLERIVLKTFLEQHELPNILTILEEIKKLGGLEYRGNKGWIIAKERSIDQEQFWETQLKTIFGDDISSQFTFKGCCFDFIHIKKKIIFEAKLNIKDFDQEQYKKYLITIGHYDMVYLIKKDTIIHIPRKTIYTHDDVDVFRLKEQHKTPSERTKFDDVLKKFDVVKINDIKDILSSI